MIASSQDSRSVYLPGLVHCCGEHCVDLLMKNLDRVPYLVGFCFACRLTHASSQSRLFWTRRILVFSQMQIHCDPYTECCIVQYAFSWRFCAYASYWSLLTWQMINSGPLASGAVTCHRERLFLSGEMDSYFGAHAVLISRACCERSLNPECKKTEKTQAFYLTFRVLSS